MNSRGFERISREQWYTDFGLDWEITYDSIKLPKRGTNFSAGYDIFTPVGISLYPGEEILIPTGIAVYMQENEFLAVYPRSGQGFKHYARLANSVGIIDADYYGNKKNGGHIWVKLRNDSIYGSRSILNVDVGEAICQGIFQAYFLADGDSYLSGSDRVGGFGSTTKQ
jgi:dUTP pyrophosphatase